MRSYIIAGGLATRVREYTEKYGCLKHEIPICGNPFHQYIEGWLHDQASSVRGVDGPTWLMEPGVGTGGVLATLERQGPILVLYGDTFTPLDIGALYGRYLHYDADMMVVTRDVTTKDYGRVTFEEGDEAAPIDEWGCAMLSFYMRHHKYDEYTTNVGIYMIGPRALDYIRNIPWEGGSLSLEDHLSRMMEDLRIYSYDTTDLPLFDVGTIPRIKSTEVMMHEYMAEDGPGGAERQ